MELCCFDADGKTEELGEKLSHCHFVHYGAHIDWCGIEQIIPFSDSVFLQLLIIIRSYVLIILIPDIPIGIPITRMYLLLLVLKSDPTLCF
jgi:hypothetical protein